MTGSNDELIKTLNNNVIRLINLYEKEKEEKLHLWEENKKLNEALIKKIEELQHIETDLNVLKVAKALAIKDDDKHQAKLKVNVLLREIDKCIALLNK